MYNFIGILLRAGGNILAEACQVLGAEPGEVERALEDGLYQAVAHVTACETGL